MSAAESDKRGVERVVREALLDVDARLAREVRTLATPPTFEDVVQLHYTRAELRNAVDSVVAAQAAEWRETGRITLRVPVPPPPAIERTISRQLVIADHITQALAARIAAEWGVDAADQWSRAVAEHIIRGAERFDAAVPRDTTVMIGAAKLAAFAGVHYAPGIRESRRRALRAMGVHSTTALRRERRDGADSVRLLARKRLRSDLILQLRSQEFSKAAATRYIDRHKELLHMDRIAAEEEVATVRPRARRA